MCSLMFYLVYVKRETTKFNPIGPIITSVKKVEGDVFKLKKDLDSFLFER